jgi:predicted nucleic acid-binding protein
MDKIIVDSSVILDVFTDAPQWADWSIDVLTEYGKNHSLIINDIIYSEISLAFETVAQLDHAIHMAGFKNERISREALIAAAKAFVSYRKNKGTKTSTLPDLYIGAHAQTLGIPLLTRDTSRIKTYFPNVKIISPEISY